MKNLTRNFLLFVLVSSIHFLSAKVTVIWQVDRTRIWEEDWLYELLEDIDADHIYDNALFEKIVDHALIIVSLDRTNKINNYFNRYKELGYRFGVIQLSDEAYFAPTFFYDFAQFVFRNYWHHQYLNHPHVFIFPLGHISGFQKDLPIRETTERKYLWSFAGEINGKPSRSTMVNAMNTINPHRLHEIRNGTDPLALKPEEYQQLLLDTVFVPCPAGWNRDTFRTWEALECGCIPIVETTPFDYYGNYIPNHPFLTVDQWHNAPQKIEKLVANPKELEDYRNRCFMWWQTYKQKIKKQLKYMIEKTLN